MKVVDLGPIANSVYMHKRWWVGLPSPIWRENKAAIEQYVKDQNLRPLKMQVLEGGIEHEPPWWKHGGMIVEHLHLGEDVYRLTAAQWNHVASAMVQASETQLRGATHIDFNETIAAVRGISELKAGG
jgi:hypothetical protein